jgi:hypothetical protein
MQFLSTGLEEQLPERREIMLCADKKIVILL